jgi:hypothetical protein
VEAASEVVSLQILVKSLAAALATLLTGRFGAEAAAASAVAAVLIADFVKEAVKRLGWGRRRVGVFLLVVLLFSRLDALVGKAFGAVARRLRRDRPTKQPGVIRESSLSMPILTSAAAIALIVGLFTVPELARGKSLVSGRKLTFFRGDRPADHGPGVLIRPSTEIAPENLASPTVSGTAQSGAQLTADPGSWKGKPTPSYSYRWRRCSSTGAGCRDVRAARGTTYRLAAGDVGRTLRVLVKAANAAGSASARSDPSGLVVPAPGISTKPNNLDRPRIVGKALYDPEAPVALKAAAGTWTGKPPPTFSYRWRRCDSEGAGCADLEGATGKTYALRESDVGHRLIVVVVARNSAGARHAASPVSPVVAEREAAVVPSNESPPSISGAPVYDPDHPSSFTADPGEWSAKPAATYSYKWRRCDGSGSSCTAIAGAAAKSHTLTQADVGERLRVVVTARNAAGSVRAPSKASAAILEVPSNTKPPAIVGEPFYDPQTSSAEVVADRGKWAGTKPIDYRFQWERCDSTGSACAEILDAVGPEHSLAAEDVGHTLRVVVAATNAATKTASRAARSSPSGVVLAVPSNTQPPTIRGPTVYRQRPPAFLTADKGVWTGSGPVSYSYQWQRCDLEGTSCSDLAGATGGRYRVTRADVGRTLVVVVTATNGSRPRSARSAATKAVESVPLNVSVPTMKGTFVYERAKRNRVIAGPGVWIAWPAPPTYHYRWQRCADAEVSKCKNVGRWSKSRVHTIQALDQCDYLRVVVYAENRLGTRLAVSKLSEQVPCPQVE